ncbi:ras-related protein Rab-20 [Caerostris extrusa]|uniref:Ras-related protein Rab-20 n=1 Tax=Caerostris extrusa TaxID=172846 RepID=A0AAV4RTS6_CAEEX|nr:ras-related protein Rab-20 [Caerostris extrusa]
MFQSNKWLIHANRKSALNINPYDSDAKVVMVGDSSIGKTSLLLRYMEREFTDCSSTIGAAFVIKTWGVHDIAIWDTAGEEKYAGMTTFYYRNATAAVLTFDMFDRASFQNPHVSLMLLLKEY